MFLHYFKIIWNQKLRNLGLLFEIFICFIVLFLVFSFVILSIQRYSNPLGFEYEKVWQLTIDTKDTDSEEVRSNFNQLVTHLKSYPQIEAVGVSGENSPFALRNSTGLVKYQDNGEQKTDLFSVSDDFFSVMQISLKEGRFFSKEDDVLATPPVVITKEAKENLFGEISPIGKLIRLGTGSYETPYKVVGVVNDYRYRGDFGHMNNGVFLRMPPNQFSNQILIRVNEAADVNFEAKMTRSAEQISKGWKLDIDYLEDKRKLAINFTFIPLVIFGIIVSFLIFNVGLGLFGILGQNISKRKGEVGIRRAIGATKGEVTTQFIIEIIILSTLSMILGSAIAIQFPLFNVLNLSPNIYFTSLGISIFVIYFIVLACAFLPSWHMAQLHPASALRDE